MNMNDIERALRQLRLSGIHATLEARVMQAQASQQPFLETFWAILQDELDRRRTRLNERRFKLARLDERLSLQDFDWRFNPKLPRQACFDLYTLKFVAEGANAMIIGKPGTGKNRVIQDWGKYLGDNTMATTILDRLMHRAAMLEFEGKSYRLKEAAARIARDTSHDA